MVTLIWNGGVQVADTLIGNECPHIGSGAVRSEYQHRTVKFAAAEYRKGRSVAAYFGMFSPNRGRRRAWRMYIFYTASAQKYIQQLGT